MLTHCKYSHCSAQVLAFVLSDVTKVRGELVDYSWSRGHLSYPSNIEAMHNTLLLDLNVDSLTLNIASGPNTNEVCWYAEHPLLSKNMSCGEGEQAEYVVTLPSGPLYSRVSLEAKGRHKTTYVVHIIRIGESINVSLSSPFNESQHPDMKGERFHEERRLSYQLSHPMWYVPDIDMSSNSILQVRMSAVVFAPLHMGTNMPDLPQIWENCACGEEEAGIGHHCDMQRYVVLENRTMCVFLTNAMLSISTYTEEAGVAGMDSDMVQWLQNVSVSGKFVGLSSHGEDETLNSSSLPFQPDDESGQRLVRSFSTMLPAKLLEPQGAHLMIASTEDHTDAEVLTVPITIDSHAPPVALNITAGIDAFFLPPFDQEDLQRIYTLCGGAAKEPKAVIATVPADSRFQVSRTDRKGDLRCNGFDAAGRDVHMSFTAHRIEDGSCRPWCNAYRRHVDNNDLAVIESPLGCLQEAMRLENTSAMVRVAKQQTASSGGRNPCLDSSGALKAAVRLNDPVAVKELLDRGASVENESGLDTSLHVAASAGSVKIMELLFHKNAEVNALDYFQTPALFAASINCSLEAVKLLLEKGALPNLQRTRRIEDKGPQGMCITVLYDLVLNSDTKGCHGPTGQNHIARVKEVMDVLIHSNASWKPDGCKDDLRGGILMASVLGFNLDAMQMVLDAGANPMEPQTWKKLNRMLSKGYSDAALLQTIKLLVDHGAKVAHATLKKAVQKCRVELVQGLMDLEANSFGVSSEGCKNVTASKLIANALARNG